MRFKHTFHFKLFLYQYRTVTRYVSLWLDPIQFNAGLQYQYYSNLLTLLTTWFACSQFSQCKNVEDTVFKIDLTKDFMLENQ